MSNTVVCSRSRYSLSFLIAIDYGGIYCRTLPKWITVYTRLAKETKRGEQLAAEAEKREELATVAAEKKEAIERELEQKKQDAEDKIEQEAEEKKGMNPEELKAAEAMEKKKEAAIKKLEDDAKAKEAVVDSGIGLNTETGASGPAVASE